MLDSIFIHPLFKPAPVILLYVYPEFAPLCFSAAADRNDGERMSSIFIIKSKNNYILI